MAILLTGAAGFIGSHVATALLARGEQVIGLDNLNDYYDIRLKTARLARLAGHAGFHFERVDIADAAAVEAVTAAHPRIDRIVHLAAQAGVRYSLTNPYAYVSSNVMGHVVMLEAARRIQGLRHMVYASSSSIYGADSVVPFAENERADTPVSLYAATKRSDELMSHAYAHLFGLPLTGLRFFTVYGPWGRPDMAYYSFARAIVRGEPITVFDGGRLKRDFTYIDDITAGVLACLDRPPGAGEAARVLNIGNHQSEAVGTLIALLEQGLGRSAVIRDAARPRTEVIETFASVDRLAALTGYAPATPLATGIARFVAWFKEWHRDDA